MDNKESGKVFITTEVISTNVYRVSPEQKEALDRLSEEKLERMKEEALPKLRERYEQRVRERELQQKLKSDGYDEGPTTPAKN